ncbi:unnamed protein product [Parajaminaea phylloscopi]
MRTQSFLAFLLVSFVAVSALPVDRGINDAEGPPHKGGTDTVSSLDHHGDSSHALFKSSEASSTATPTSTSLPESISTTEDEHRDPASLPTNAFNQTQATPTGQQETSDTHDGAVPAIHAHTSVHINQGNFNISGFEELMGKFFASLIHVLTGYGAEGTPAPAAADGKTGPNPSDSFASGALGQGGGHPTQAHTRQVFNGRHSHSLTARDDQSHDAAQSLIGRAVLNLLRAKPTSDNGSCSSTDPNCNHKHAEDSGSCNSVINCHHRRLVEWQHHPPTKPGAASPGSALQQRLVEWQHHPPTKPGAVAQDGALQQRLVEWQHHPPTKPGAVSHEDALQERLVEWQHHSPTKPGAVSHEGALQQRLVEWQHHPPTKPGAQSPPFPRSPLRIARDDYEGRGFGHRPEVTSTSVTRDADGPCIGSICHRRQKVSDSERVERDGDGPCIGSECHKSRPQQVQRDDNGPCTGGNCQKHHPGQVERDDNGPCTGSNCHKPQLDQGSNHLQSADAKVHAVSARHLIRDESGDNGGEGSGGGGGGGGSQHPHHREAATRADGQLSSPAPSLRESASYRPIIRTESTSKSHSPRSLIDEWFYRDNRSHSPTVPPRARHRAAELRQRSSKGSSPDYTPHVPINSPLRRDQGGLGSVGGGTGGSGGDPNHGHHRSNTGNAQRDLSGGSGSGQGGGGGSNSGPNGGGGSGPGANGSNGSGGSGSGGGGGNHGHHRSVTSPAQRDQGGLGSVGGGTGGSSGGPNHGHHLPRDSNNDQNSSPGQGQGGQHPKARSQLVGQERNEGAQAEGTSEFRRQVSGGGNEGGGGGGSSGPGQGGSGPGSNGSRPPPGHHHGHDSRGNDGALAEGTANLRREGSSGPGGGSGGGTSSPGQGGNGPGSNGSRPIHGHHHGRGFLAQQDSAQEGKGKAPGSSGGPVIEGRGASGNLPGNSPGGPGRGSGGGGGGGGGRSPPRGTSESGAMTERWSRDESRSKSLHGVIAPPPPPHKGHQHLDDLALKQE